MKMPGFSAEASLSTTILHYHFETTDYSHEPSGVTPQQFEHPPFTNFLFAVSASIRTWIIPTLAVARKFENLRYKANPFSPEGGSYVCGPCIEQRCSPFVAVDIFPLSLNLSP